MTDAESTVRFAVLDGIVSSAHITGLRAGKPSEALVQSIMESLKNPSTVWALKELGAQLDRQGG